MRWGSLHTTSWTKLLYWPMFRFKISWQGPSTRSKRARSSFTHLRVHLAFTVAARGLFRSRAISPEEKEERKEWFVQCSMLNEISIELHYTAYSVGINSRMLVVCGQRFNTAGVMLKATSAKLFDKWLGLVMLPRLARCWLPLLWSEGHVVQIISRMLQVRSCCWQY